MPEARLAENAWPPAFGATREDRDAIIRLAYLQRMIPRDLHALAWRVGSARACVGAILRGAGSPADRAVVAAADPDRVRERLRQLGARVLTPVDREYPERVLDLHDPPACLFVRGRSLDELGDAVAVVGARSCTPYGREAASTIAAELAEARLTVVSGAALGIDGMAHEGALLGGGHTVAVLGSGFDRPHPKTNVELIERIAAEGTVLTEHPPGVDAQPRWFPRRNRIIAALSRAVLVVEGTSTSGALKTAEFGAEIGREMMAIPGPIDSPLSAAPHTLLRNGAALVAEADDVLAALELYERISGGETVPVLTTDEERRVLDAVSGRPASIEEIAEAAALPPGRVLVVAAGLELLGLVEGHGGRYRVAPRRRLEEERERRQAARSRPAPSR